MSEDALLNEITQAHGLTLIETLRAIYGEDFAPGFQASATLAKAISRMRGASLAWLIKAHRTGQLSESIRRQGNGPLLTVAGRRRRRGPPKPLPPLPLSRL